jgi:hypothetical protein
MNRIHERTILFRFLGIGFLMKYLHYKTSWKTNFAQGGGGGGKG